MGDRIPATRAISCWNPETQSGFVVVSNREDTNGYRIALLGMAALLDLPLPTPSTVLQDGLYVSESGRTGLRSRAA